MNARCRSKQGGCSCIVTVQPIGVAALPLLLPGSDVRVPFGVDERIRINVRDERAQSGRRGILNKQSAQRTSPALRDHELSRHGAAHRGHRSRAGSAGVRHQNRGARGATAPTVRNLDGKEGVYLWKLPGTPKKTESIHHYYSVRYPSDRALSPAETGG